MFQLDVLKNEKSKLDQVIDTIKEGRYIIYLRIKEMYDNHTNFKGFESIPDNLNQAMQNLTVKSFSIAKYGSEVNNIPRNSVEIAFRFYFGKGNYQIIVCTSEIRIPDESERPSILA